MNLTPDEAIQFREMRKIIGQNIHSQRINKKMHISDCAKRSGISIYKLDSYELGKVEITIPALVKLARIFNVNVGTFFVH